MISDGPASQGDVVRVLSGRGEHLGHAFYSSKSKITLRMVNREEAPPDRGFWASRVDEALGYRERIVGETSGYRLIFGESDGIPGLVVDRYAEHLVVQTLTTATERILPVVLDILEERVPVASVLARNDPAARAFEGLSREVRQLRGVTPSLLEVREGPVRYEVDPWKGQKTGAFLDQRENRIAASAYARGRVLDAFCFQGAFALHAARSAETVECVDGSAKSLARGRADAMRNAIDNVSFTEANVFDDLRARERRGETFDVIFLDPPAFAKSRADLPAASRGYKEINLRAMRLLRPGGVLVSSSCSYNLQEAGFLHVLHAAASDARRYLRLVEKRTQSRDHPILLGFPESHYLKCAILQRT